MSFAGRALRRALRIRPIPQLRILRTYHVSLRRQPRLFLLFMLRGRETTNFTYDLANTDELVEFVAAALERPVSEIAGYVREVEEDTALRSALSARLARRKDRNPQPLFGRRVGWYCLVRALRPRLVVETGTADGLGTALLARALRNNALSGSPGELLSFDIDPKSGWLLDMSELEEFVLSSEMPRPQSRSELGGRAVDLFIHDSDHTYDNERAELELAIRHGSDELVLVSDNAHATTALREICYDHGIDVSVLPGMPCRTFLPRRRNRAGTRRRTLEQALAFASLKVGWANKRVPAHNDP